MYNFYGRTELNTSHKPILVTGSHRSGTTWVGKVLATAPGMGYLQEPFGLQRRPGLCGAPFRFWFTYISSENDFMFYPSIKQTLAFQFNPHGQWHTLKSARAVAGTGKNFSSLLYYRLAHVRPLLKDPLAFFSAPWLAERFGTQVLVLIRHPAAFVSSIKILNWHLPFADMLAQPALMRDYLYPFEKEITLFANVEQDLVDQAALFWKLIHHTVLVYQQQHPDWIFVRHEDLSRNPQAEFRALFKQLDLTWTPQIEAMLERTTQSKDMRDPGSKGAFVLKRNSRANVSQWKKRLAKEEIVRVKTMVQDIASHFYSEADWEPSLNAGTIGKQDTGLNTRHIHQAQT